MRMLLTSNGVTPGPVHETVLELLGKPIAESRIAVVIDAMLPFPGDNSTMLRHLNALHALGWAEYDLMSLLGGPRSVIESRLRGADVIFGYGGTNHWLAHAWRASGLAPVLRELLDEKVYVGMSAGSMIFCRRHADVVEAFDDQAEVRMLELDEVAAAVPLFDWWVQCHLGADWMPADTDAVNADGAARLGSDVWVLDDASALLVRDPAEPPRIVSRSRWQHFDGRGRLVEAG